MRLIMVTSALPGDGKTFTSINLALSMARERDISVLLVDGDTARARISEVLGLRQQPGLLDALADESTDVESLVARTDVHGLEVLPAGRFAESSTELIASVRMAQIAVRLTATNPRRLVLIDSGPVLASSDARALMRTPGQIVLVVRGRHAASGAARCSRPDRQTEVAGSDCESGAGDFGERELRLSVLRLPRRTSGR